MGSPAAIASTGIDLFHYWLKRRLEAGSKLSYADYAVQTLLSDEDKAPWPYGGSSSIAELGSYAFHLDASALGDYLREIATGEGVQHLFGNVQDVAFDDKGNIANLDIGGGRTIAGDLFVDATGFRGRLIEQALGDPWIDWSNYMLCDSAVAMPLPRMGSCPALHAFKSHACRLDVENSAEQPNRKRLRVLQRAPFAGGRDRGLDRAVRLARDSGSRSASDLNSGRAPDEFLVAQLHFGRTGIGFHRAVGIDGHSSDPAGGDAAGRLYARPPVQRRLAPSLQCQNGRLYDEIRDFIVLHYILSQRDEPFWRDARNVPLPDTLRENLALYDETGRIDSPRLQLFLDANYFFILSGNGRLPRRPIIEADLAPSNEIRHLLDRVEAGESRFCDPDADRMRLTSAN